MRTLADLQEVFGLILPVLRQLYALPPRGRRLVSGGWAVDLVMAKG
jgi:hypothetical protein